MFKQPTENKAVDDARERIRAANKGPNPDTMREALAVVGRLMATGTEQAQLRGVVQEIDAKGGPTTPDEHRVCSFVTGQAFILPSDDRAHPPNELFQRVDAKVAIEADFLAARSQSLEAVVLARLDATKARGTKNADDAADRVRAAENAYQLAYDAHHRAHSATLRAQMAIDAWRRNRAIEENDARNADRNAKRNAKRK